MRETKAGVWYGGCVAHHPFQESSSTDREPARTYPGQYPGTNVFGRFTGKSLSMPGGPTTLTFMFLNISVGMNPRMQLQPANSKGILQILSRSGAKPIDGN